MSLSDTLLISHVHVENGKHCDGISSSSGHDSSHVNTLPEINH